MFTSFIILSLKVRVKTYFKYNSVKYHPIMLDIEEDLCAFFSGFIGSKVVSIFAEQWKRYGNFVQPCPLEVITLHYIRI